jgi:hypothetical protein
VKKQVSVQTYMLISIYVIKRLFETTKLKIHVRKPNESFPKNCRRDAILILSLHCCYKRHTPKAKQIYTARNLNISRNKVKLLQHIQQIIPMLLKCNIILLEYAWLVMVISFIHPTTCGFAKVIAWQLEKSTQSKAVQSEGESLPKFRSRIS